MDAGGLIRTRHVLVAGLIIAVGFTVLVGSRTDGGATTGVAAGHHGSHDASAITGGCGEDCAARVTIEGGTLEMGCTEGTPEDCLAKGFLGLPVHDVTISTFEMDRYETTVARYAACVDAGACESTAFDSRYCNWGKAERSEHPINCVDWDRARAFCAWAGGRLCSESEWEWAARGPEGRKWPWGDDDASCERAVMNEGGYGCGADSTLPVGSKPAGATAQGVYDMGGNVWEWTEDTDADGDGPFIYDGAPVDGSPRLDPAFSDRIIRGGSLSNVAKYLVTWDRHYLERDNNAAYYVGIRCCRSK